MAVPAARTGYGALGLSPAGCCCVPWPGPIRRERTVAATRAAACAGAWCSQTRGVTQPAAARRSSVSRSRAWLRSTFSDQYPGFDVVGRRPWSGQPCQKQPSMKTATLAGRKTMSAGSVVGSVPRIRGPTSETGTGTRRPAPAPAGAALGCGHASFKELVLPKHQ